MDLKEFCEGEGSQRGEVAAVSVYNHGRVTEYVLTDGRRWAETINDEGNVVLQEWAPPIPGTVAGRAWAARQQQETK